MAATEREDDLEQEIIEAMRELVEDYGYTAEDLDQLRLNVISLTPPEGLDP
jgi:hypothetical protein